MNFKTRIAVLVGASALALTPTAAVAQGAKPPEKAKAHGVHCQGLSKKHVAGEKGTPFSRCVTGAAQAKKDQT